MIIKNNNKNSNNDNRNNTNNSNNNRGNNNNNNNNNNKNGIYNHNVIRIISSKSFSHHNTRNIDVTVYRLWFIEYQWQVFEWLTFPPLSYYSPKFQKINVADNRIRYEENRKEIFSIGRTVSQSNKNRKK